MNLQRLDYLAARLCEASYEGHLWRLDNMLGNYCTLKGKQHGAFVVVGESPEYNFLIVRGTSVGKHVDWRDILTDLRFAMRKVPGNRLELHSGFFDAWQEVAPEAYAAVQTLHYQQAMDGEPCKPWVFTGHSLGAAVATIAAAAFKPAHCVTFGSPRVGGEVFAGVAEDACFLRRYVNEVDVCTRVPPASLGYRHAGELHYIDRHGALHVNPTKTAVLMDRLAGVFGWLGYHGIGKYVDRLEALL